MQSNTDDASNQDDEIDAYFADAKRRYPYREKSLPIAYLYLIRGGVFQSHRFYLRLYKTALIRSGIFIIFACLGGGLALIDHIGAGTLILVGAFLFALTTMAIDWFRLPQMIEEYNLEMRSKRIELGLE